MAPPIGMTPPASPPVDLAAGRCDSFWSVKAMAARQAEASGQAMAVACPACGDLGWLRAGARPGEPEFGRLVRCPTCAEPERRRWLAQNCGLEGTALALRLDDWMGGRWTETEEAERQRLIQQRREAWKALRGAVDGRVGLWTFWGDFGAGKTHALAVIVNECRERLGEAYYAPLATLLDHLRALIGARLETSDYWRRLLDVPVLALDEVTRFNATDWAREKLFVLVDTRYRRRASHLTAFATNEDPRRALPPGEDMGYLFSRMREGRLVELRGDMRIGK